MQSGRKLRIIEAHRPQWSSAWAWLAFLAVFGATEALSVWSLLCGPVWLIVPLTVLTAHLMHAHLIALHEAAHRTLCPSRRWNDCVGMFIGTLGFLPFSLYRVAHHSHHAFLATERDEELWPFVSPGTPRWARRLAALLELTLGILYTPWLFLRAFLRDGSTIRSRSVRRRIWAEYVLMACVWCSLLTVSAWCRAIPYLLLAFGVPAVLAGNMQSLRKYIEHMGLTGSTVLASTRSVVPHGPIGRLVAFSLFDIPYHGVHQRFAGMPHAKMPEFSSILAPTNEEEPSPYPSYRSALWDMLRSLSDPRVGAQWIRSRKAGPESRPSMELQRKMAA